MNKKAEETIQLKDAILEGIQRIKGEKITIIDLKTIHHTECDYFVICSGNSNTQVDSLAHSVEKTVDELCEQKVIHREGYRNAWWILLDYGDIMVHVFQKEARDFYNLEGLWADASITEIEN